MNGNFHLRKGGMLPPFRLAEASGAQVRFEDYRGRRNLVLFRTDPPGCAGCEATLRELASGSRQLAAEEAEVLAVVPAPVAAAADLKRRLALPFPVLADPERTLGEGAALAVADRFGEIFFAAEADARHEFPPVPQIIEEVAFIEVQCPE